MPRELWERAMWRGTVEQGLGHKQNSKTTIEASELIRVKKTRMFFIYIDQLFVSWKLNTELKLSE